MLKLALFINVAIVILEVYTLAHIKGKQNILKYYTYLQNLIALIASLLFSVCLASGRTVPEYAKGLRYLATCGLAATMFIFVVFLGAGKKIAITQDDFLGDFSPKRANMILHYLCPALSLVSFVFFEREISLSNGIWTGLAAIPSCAYWIVYLILTGAKLWEEPYRFTSAGQKTTGRDVLTMVMLPLSFMAISFVLWNIQ